MAGREHPSWNEHAADPGRGLVLSEYTEPTRSVNHTTRPHQLGMRFWCAGAPRVMVPMGGKARRAVSAPAAYRWARYDGRHRPPGRSPPTRTCMTSRHILRRAAAPLAIATSAGRLQRRRGRGRDLRLARPDRREHRLRDHPQRRRDRHDQPARRLWQGGRRRQELGGHVRDRQARLDARRDHRGDAEARDLPGRLPHGRRRDRAALRGRRRDRIRFVGRAPGASPSTAARRVARSM